MTSTAQHLISSIASLSLEHNKENENDYPNNAHHHHRLQKQQQQQHPTTNKVHSPTSPNNNNNSNSNSNSYHHYHHGFTNDALQKLNASRALLTAYKERQMTLIDEAHQRKQNTYKLEQEKIASAMRELRSIQRQRGVHVVHAGDNGGDGGGDGGDDDDDSGDVDSGDVDNGENHAEKKERLHQKRMEVERNLANLHLKQKETQKRVVALREEETEVFARAEQKRRVKERIEKSKQVSVEDLTIAIVKYKELGLDFVKGEDESLEIIFTKLMEIEDHHDGYGHGFGSVSVGEGEEGYECEQTYITNHHEEGHEQEQEQVCSFLLQVTPDTDEYQVVDCAPELDPDVVMKLVDDLNRNEEHSDPTLQFPTFIRGMRKAFKAYLASEASS